MILLLVAAAGLAVAITASSFVEGHRKALPDGFADQDLAFKGKRLKGFVLGADGLVADVYWMASLQYIGDKIVNSEGGLDNIENLRPLNPRLLYPYLDNATELDPKFITAYSYGAIILPAIDSDQAIALTRKGIEHNPDQWRLYQYLGYIYWRLKDYERAAQTYEQGSAIEGSPIFMKMMSAAMRTQGGSRDTARGIYHQMLDEASDQQTRDMAQLRLYQLDSLDERDAVGKALEAFRTRNGRCAVSLFEVLPFLRHVELPNGVDFHLDASGSLVDPTGVPYVLNANECRADLSPNSRVPRA